MPRMVPSLIKPNLVSAISRKKPKRLCILFVYLRAAFCLSIEAEQTDATAICLAKVYAHEEIRSFLSGANE